MNNFDSFIRGLAVWDFDRIAAGGSAGSKAVFGTRESGGFGGNSSYHFDSCSGENFVIEE
jgi:hypothetical protein